MKDDEVLTVKKDEDGELVFNCKGNEEMLVKVISLIVEGSVQKMVEMNHPHRRIYQFGASILDVVEEKVMDGIRAVLLSEKN